MLSIEVLQKYVSNTAKDERWFSQAKLTNILLLEICERQEKIIMILSTNAANAICDHGM